MKKIFFLDELLKEDQEKVKKLVPEKAEGIVLIKRLLDKGELNQACKYPIQVNNFFVGNDISQTNKSEFEEAYRKLVEPFRQRNERRIILARSLNFNEAPGKFSTYPSLFNPNSTDESFQNWYSAMIKVQNAGSRGIMAHVLSSEEEDFAVKDYRENGRREIVYDRIKSFGGTNAAFYIRSYSEIGSIDSQDKSICFMTRGLGAKLTSGDKDIVLAIVDKSEKNTELRFANLKHDYSFASKALYDPSSIFIIKSEEPDTFSRVDYDMGTRDETIARPDIGFEGTTEVPFNLNWVGGDMTNPFRLNELFRLIRFLKEKTNSEIELEGTLHKQKGFYICQLRRYKVQLEENICLSNSSNNQIVFRTYNDNLELGRFKGEFSMGNCRFNGPMYISDKVENIDREGFLVLSDGLYNYDFSKLKGIKKVCLIPREFKGGKYLGQHAFGAIVNASSKLNDLGIQSIILSPTWNTICENPERYFKDFTKSQNQIIVPNVVLECNSQGAQLFYKN